MLPQLIPLVHNKAKSKKFNGLYWVSDTLWERVYSVTCLRFTAVNHQRVLPVLSLFWYPLSRMKVESFNALVRFECSLEYSSYPRLKSLSSTLNQIWYLNLKLAFVTDARSWFFGAWVNVFKLALVLASVLALMFILWTRLHLQRIGLL